jgi:RNA polymerase sigma-70 factor, ECF subfamily
MERNNHLQVLWGKEIPLSQVNDADLLAGVALLESGALGETHDRYYPQLFSYAYLRTGDETVAAHIAGDALYSLLEALYVGRPPRLSLRGWLFGAASYLIAEHFNNKDQSESGPGELLIPGNAAKNAPQSALLEAILKLPGELQQALTLRFGSGFSEEETARMLRGSVSTVKEVQLRAVENLLSLLGDLEHG